MEVYTHVYEWKSVEKKREKIAARSSCDRDSGKTLKLKLDSQPPIPVQSLMIFRRKTAVYGDTLRVEQSSIQNVWQMSNRKLESTCVFVHDYFS